MSRTVVLTGSSGGIGKAKSRAAPSVPEKMMPKHRNQRIIRLI